MRRVKSAEELIGTLRMSRPDTYRMLASTDCLLTPEEAGRLLGVRRRTVIAWARRGEIPHIVLKRGRDGRAAVVRFNSKKLREWLATKEEAG